jgi:hypothetical protein
MKKHAESGRFIHHGIKGGARHKSPSMHAVNGMHSKKLSGLYADKCYCGEPRKDFLNINRVMMALRERNISMPSLKAV